MYKQGIIGVDFAICNTDNQSMENSIVPVKIHLGPELTEGRGAGSRPQIGKEACIESIDAVRSFLNPSTKMLFVTAGMGGGTGTGAAPIIAKAAQEMNILTVGIVTLPFSFEGRKRVDQAKVGLEELKRCVDSIIVISNDKLRDIHGNLAISEAFSKADDILTVAAKGIAEIITVPGYVNVDFEDVNTVMRKSGVSIMGTAVMEGQDRAKKAVSMALNSPLLEENDIRGADHILVNITSGTQEVTMDEVFEITEYVQGEAGHGTNLIWGNCVDETLGDRIAVTIIATGFQDKLNLENQADRPAEKIVVSLDEDLAVSTDDSIFEVGLSSGEESQTFEFESNSVYTRPDKVVSDLHEDEPFIKTKAEINSEASGQQALFNATSSLRDRSFSDAKKVQPARVNNPKSLADMENVPAYLRQRVQLDAIPNKEEMGMSDWSINAENEPVYKKNPYLHDNVD
ncbi:UNVERIFIED_CONTAM: hypothetical protein GTU68_014786 [Idotea baltica]|nr:hypothetical protein [Idotea baltica]